MPIIDAYRTDTGDKVRIPEHWIGHPKLGKPFRKTPVQKARDEQPDETWTNDRLRRFAENNGIDVSGASNKAELLSAIDTTTEG